MPINYVPTIDQIIANLANKIDQVAQRLLQGPQGVIGYSITTGPTGITGNTNICTIAKTFTKGRLYRITAQCTAIQRGGTGNPQCYISDTGAGIVAFTLLLFQVATINQTLFGSTQIVFTPASTTAATIILVLNTSANTIDNSSSYLCVEDLGSA